MTTAVVFVGSSVVNTPKFARVRRKLTSEYGNCLAHSLSKDPNDNLYGLSYYAKAKSLRIFRFYMGLLFLFLNLLKTRPAFCYAINPIAGAIVMAYCSLFSKKYIYEGLEIFTGMRGSFFSRNRRMFSLLERLIITRASHYVVTDEFRAKFNRRYYRLRCDKISYIYNTCSFDTAEVPKTPSVSFSYCGVVMPGRGLEIILEAFAIFRNKICPEALLTLAGGCHTPEYLTSLKILCEDLGLSQFVAFPGQVTSDEIRILTAQSHATFAFYSRSSLNNRLCSPNKYFDALSVDTYLICNASPLSKSLIRRLSCGYAVPAIDISNVLQAMCSIYSNQNELQVPSAAQKFTFSWEAQEEKLISLVRSAMFTV